ncbi:MAG TPA: DNA repair protein RecN [Burkholderiales bacterium]|jgi:DNA repair protein RecN (Recombination protein N)|nr:DNA repair protein RecN [Burkholderiales bacterium]
MLLRLTIRDFVIVDRLELEFAPGFTVLTGETGAGKSILVDALAMVLGARAEANVVRQGAERAEIGAEFDPALRAAARRWLAENDLAGDEGGCLVRRVIESGGRSRGYINGRPATLAQLRELGELFVDIHGQHEHQSLARQAAQRELLDSYGGLEDAAGKVGASFRAWQQRRRSRIDSESNAAAYAAERAELEWQVRELESLKLGAGEWQELTEQHARLAHAASLLEAAQFGSEVLSEGESASLAQVNQVVARLTGLTEFDPGLKDILDVLEPARIQLQEAAHGLRRYADRVDLDPQRLREVERRLDAVHGAARKFRVKPEELPERLAAARARLDELGSGGDAGALRMLEEQALAECSSEAKKLSAGRKKAAKKLSEQVTAAMQDLAMAGGRFEVALPPATEVTASGLEGVEFLVSAHKGVEPRSLTKVASGGELSRLSLAIQAAATQVAHVPTLVFDEVDSGIGGRVAEIVGRMLKQLGGRHQVMCITHLPQVAASADQQWQVAKNAANGQVLSRVTVLGREERVEEIARMLGGVKITETTRKHAAEMLKGGDR